MVVYKGLLVLSLTAAAAMPFGAALAQEPGFFAGVDVIGGVAEGSSETRNGGGFGGGGVVKNVKFGTATGIGAHAGYQFSQRLSGFVSYQHVSGDIDWDVSFPLFGGQTNNFSGKATSDAVLLNVAYDWFPSDKTTIRATAGAGTAFNTLSDVMERYDGFFVSHVEDHTEVSPMIQLGAGIHHHLSPRVTVGLDARVAYTGGYRTGDTRNGNLGTTSINPYKIDNVWRASLGISLRARF